MAALSALIAQFIRQDTFLVLATVAIALAIALVLYRLIQSGRIGRQSLVVLGVFCLASIVTAVVLWASLASVEVTPIQVSVVEPQDGTVVERSQHLVKGVVSDANARVYVVVRPLRPLDYWVQERPTVDSLGNWQVNAHFGEAGTGVGESYEIIALATNENFLVTLMTGNLLGPGKTDNIPINTNRSNFVTVTRTR